MPGRDQRAEHQQQQDQRDGHRGRLGLPEAVPIRALATRSVLASPASGIRRPGWPAWTAATAWSAGAHRLVLVSCLSGDVEGDQSAAAVRRRPAQRCRGPAASAMSPRGVRAARAARRRPARTAWRICGSGRTGRSPRGWISTFSCGGAATPEPLQGLLGLAGLAGVVGRQVLARQLLPGDEHRRHQDEPAEHGGLAVPGAPARHALDDRGAGPAGRGSRAVRFRAILNSRLAHHGLSPGVRECGWPSPAS